MFSWFFQNQLGKLNGYSILASLGANAKLIQVNYKFSAEIAAYTATGKMFQYRSKAESLCYAINCQKAIRTKLCFGWLLV